MRHRFHAICPYFAMFPERFVQKHLVWSNVGDLVFDPFSGRGTTVFESLLNGRSANGCDTNAVAVCVSNAKSNPPTRNQALIRLAELEGGFRRMPLPAQNHEFFKACFHSSTLHQILYLRKALRWKSRRDDCFIAALVLGSLHGESHRSERYFSNRMPRTISTKPSYSVEYWKRNGDVAPKREVFGILRSMIDFRFSSEIPEIRGRVKMGDARKAFKLFPQLKRRVSLIITSPPYLDITDFAEDQWLRLWFLGGPPTPHRRVRGDDRHTSAGKYWTFLSEVWTGVEPLLKPNSNLVIRIGGRLAHSEIRQGLLFSLRQGLNSKFELKSERASEIGDGQVKIFQPEAKGTNVEYDFRVLVA
jgi:hypothetical protein